MNKFLLPLAFIFIKVFFVQMLSLPWPMLDLLLSFAVIYTFFHSLDTKDWLFYALFCGALRELFSLEVFGLYLFSFPFSCLVVSLLARLFYRHNWLFVFPSVFIGCFFNSYLVLFLKTFFFAETVWRTHQGWFLARTLLESFGSTALTYPVYKLSKKCASELIG